MTHRVALVAVDRAGIVGVGRFDALGDGSAEVAFVIRDDLQGLGLGSVLLEHLAAAARERGVRRFVAEVLPDNVRMIATFREAGYEVRQRREDDVLAVSFDIEPTASSRAVMEAREHRAEARSVHRLLHPARVAVVGASRSPGGLGHELLRHIVAGGYRGDLVAVHPEVDEIARRSLRASPRRRRGDHRPGDRGRRPAERVAGVIEDAARAGVHGLVVVSGGFGDVRGARATAWPSSPTSSPSSTAPGCASWARTRSGSSTPIRRRAPQRLPRRRDAARRPHRVLQPVGCPGRADPRALPAPGPRACRRSSRPATAPTSRATTCSSTGRTIPRPTWSCSTWRRSATPASSPASSTGSRRSKPVVMVRTGRGRPTPPARAMPSAAPC